MFSGGMIVLVVGVTGAIGVAVIIGPGGGGCACVAVLLDVPGSTTVSESCMLGLVFVSGCLLSAKAL